MGNMCHEAKQTNVNHVKAKSHKTLLSTIDEYQNPIDEMRQFLSLTSQNTPSCDFEKQTRKKKHQRTITDFKVIRVLGQGSFGKVMLVTDIVDGKLYAMKIIEKKSIKTEKDKKHTMSQRYILEAMDNPFVVKLHYAFQNAKKLYLFVDFMGGGELFYLLRRSGKFKQDIVRFYAAELLLAIEYLHSRKIIYRDMKPQNILLDQDGHIKISDFGLSRVCKNQSQIVYSMCGTPEYIAPQIIMRQGYNQTADWFSFASVIYDMLTGKPPFYNKNKNQMLKNLCTKVVPIPEYVSDTARSLLKGLFTINPNKRLGFQNGAEDIKKHPFFNDINFELICKRRIKPPFSFQQQVNQNGFDNRLKQKIPLDSLRQDNRLGDFYDNFSYQKSIQSQGMVDRTIDNSKGFTLQVVEMDDQE